MKAVILAAGEGLRCRPLTFTRSKVMLPVANKPLLWHLIKALSENGIKEIIIVVGYKKEKIMDYFGNGSDCGVEITYVFQHFQLGTADAIKQVENLIDGDFLVINGDNLIDKNMISDVLQAYEYNKNEHDKNKKEKDYVTLVGVKRAGTIGYGVIIKDSIERTKVIKILEKPRDIVSNIVNAGIYIFPPEIFEDIKRRLELNETNEYAITDTIQQIIDRGKIVRMVESRSMWIDAVHSWDLLKANSMFLDKYFKLEEGNTIKGILKDGVSITGNIYLGDNSIIYPGCNIIGPVIIGKNCSIGPNNVILSSTMIGDNTSIGPFVEIQNSIIMNDVSIGSNSFISNSIVGANNSIGSHFVTDVGNDISIEISGTLYRAEVLGTVIGDDNIIGNRVLIKAGKTISNNFTVESGINIYKDIISGSVIG
jgi:UDP-N-acetylglucosamine diphosphorylase/glucosamine-1-phosphate N-acetyltransferase